MDLKEFFRQHPKAAIAFSGGVDSSLSAVRRAAVRRGRARLLRQGARSSRSLSWMTRSVLPATFARRADGAARWTCCRDDDGDGQSRQPLLLLQAGRVLRDCAARALADGYTVLLDGTNASRRRRRPPRHARAAGAAGALAAARVRPDEAGDPRGCRSEAGLFTWDKPAYACLATRIPTGRDDHRREAAARRRAPRASCSRYGLHRLPRALCTRARRGCSSRRCSCRVRWSGVRRS